MTAATHPSWKQRLLGSVRGSVPLTSLAYAADNALATMGITASDPAEAEHLGGNNVDADVDYARAVAANYLRYGNIRGRVAEIGPGGSAAVALLLIANGCDSVDLLDRFHHPQADRGWRSSAAIIRSEPALARRGNDQNLAVFGIAFHVGEDAAAERFFRRNVGYDAIVSCAVMEHLFDPMIALGAMMHALKPGGSLVHQIDFRDHGMFSAAGHHELTFLTIPAWFYSLMSQRRGRPNRVLIDRYRSRLGQEGWPYEIFVTHLVGVGEVAVPAPYGQLPADERAQAENAVRSIQGRLAADFAGVPVEDLAVAGAMVAAKRPL